MPAGRQSDEQHYWSHAMIHQEPNGTKDKCQVCEIEIPTSQKLCDQCKTWLAIGAQIDDLREALREVT